VKKHILADLRNGIRTAAFGGEVVLVHEFHRPPYGGGNQFLLALREELRRQGLTVSRNRVGTAARAVLFNSFNFNLETLREMRRRHQVRMVHRVDGPVSAYRGKDEELDRDIWKINHELADATVFQSHYSLNKHREMGLEFKSPCVIMNSADSAIFNAVDRVRPPRAGEPIKLISTSWSDNPRKGLDVYRYLDETLDSTRYEYTFVGRCQASFRNIRHLQPVASRELAALLRSHHLYIAASENDPCSNALIEALSCGLPAVYLRSGGHPEIVREAGLGFGDCREIWPAVAAVAARYQEFQNRIAVPAIETVGRSYREVLLNPGTPAPVTR